MAEKNRPRLRFSDPEGEDLMQYQRVSRLAIVSVGLALLAPTALLDPLLWTIPLAAAALAFAALRMIGAGESGLTGRKTAAAALAIALFFGGAAAARDLTRHLVLYQQARRFSLRCLQLVLAGQAMQAHQLHLAYEEREKPGASLERSYAWRPPPPPSHELRFRRASLHDQLAAFQQNSVLAAMIAHRRSGRIEFQRNVRQHCFDGSWRITQQFVFHYDQDGQPQSLPFKAVCIRMLDSKGRNAHWLLDEVEELPP